MRSASRLDILNIACMAAAAVTAYFLPLPLFLLSYAVLGPAHYLTEIRWLHQRRYFTEHRLPGWAVAGAVAAAAVALGVAHAVLEMPALRAWAPGALATILVLLLGALTASFVRLTWQRALVFSALLLGSGFCPPLYVACFIFLPTLIHVYGFTAAFLLAGTLRAPSRSAWAACAAFVLCPLALVLASGLSRGAWSAAPTHPAYVTFLPLTHALAGVLPGFTPGEGTLLATRLIAWAYCYHYLNWFTKTRHIGFLNTSGRQLGLLVFLWAAAVALYVWDYAIGLRWLYCLSFLHVLLEFPLNRLTFAAIGRHLFTRRLGSTAPAP